MSEPTKAIYPVESRIIAPLNEGGNFTANNYILFRFSAADLQMWLVNDSYLTFDLKWTQTAFTKTGTSTAFNSTYIRNACNIFRSIEVLYGGDTIYTQPYNIEQNTLKQLSLGESYMRSNYATYTTTSMVKDGTAYLTIPNAEAGATETIRNVMIPINQLIPLFMDINSVGFPVRNLKKQIEFRLYIAEPYRYLCDYDSTIGDFSIYFKSTGTGAATQTNANATIKNRFAPTNISLEKVKMYCATYTPKPEEMGVIDSQINGAGMKFRYSMWQTALRQVPKISTTNNLPFSCTTENTQALMLYAHETDHSPCLMIRPNVQSLYIRFGENQLPFQPIAGDSWSTPFEYKFTSDDVLNNIDTYFSETNSDYNYSYKYKARPADVAGAEYTSLTVPASSFVLMGANYTSAPDALGSASSRWNSQYQAQFNCLYEQTMNMTFVLGVKTEFGMIVKNGDISTINI